MSKNMRKYFVAQQKYLGALNGHIEETVTGYKTVVAFNKQSDATETFEGISSELKKAGIKAQIFNFLSTFLTPFSPMDSFLFSIS